MVAVAENPHPQTAHRDDVSLSGLRYYSPEQGRWLNRDPIGEHAVFLRFSRGMSRRERKLLFLASLLPEYLFVENDPISSRDVLGLFKTTEACCMILATGNPSDLSHIASIADLASGLANDWYSTRGERNAYRHCLGACMLTKEFGIDVASAIENCHEVHGDSSEGGGGPQDTAADEHNNVIGNEIGQTPGSSCVADCDAAMDNGDLIIHPPIPQTP